MTHFLRHTAVCLWLALLLTVGAGLWLLPALQSAVGMEVIPFVAAGSLAAAFMGVGWATTRFGLRQVKGRLKAAAQAERDGLPAESEAELRDALAVLDRFWVSSSARRRTAVIIAARLARLYLAHERLAPGGEAFVDAYLAQFPADAEAAESWAAQAEQRGGLTEGQQELVGRLVRRYPENAVITRAAARLYLMLERTDYDALQCYRRLCDHGMPPDDLRAAVARVVGQPGIAAGDVPPPAAHAAVVPAAGKRARPAPMPLETRKAESDTPALVRAEPDETEQPFRMTAAREDAEEDEEESPAPGRAGRSTAVRRGAQACRDAVGTAFAGMHRAWAVGVTGLLPAVRRLWHAPASRHVMGAAAVAGLGALLIWLVATAMDDYFSRPPEAPATTAEVPTVQPSAAVTDDPYTLQVAAYIKQEGALKLVEDLKRRGLDAYSTETSSGGKVYYQVRISHFPDQQSARDFGRSLKGKGVIEDFYVTNYVR